MESGLIRVLILEDDTVNRNVVRSLLTKFQDVMAYGAASFGEAVSLCKENRFDLFLLDVDLGEGEGQNGIAFAKKIRQEKQYAFTPIVMITSVASLEIEAYRKIHCYQYLLKPFRKEEVEGLVEKILSSQEGKKEGNIKEDTLIVKKNGINYRVRIEEIRMIKAVPRGVGIIMKRELLLVPYLSLRQLLPKLWDSFLQCHRMYVINTSYVEYYDLVNRMIKMEGQEELVEIGITYKNQVKQYMEQKKRSSF